MKKLMIAAAAVLSLSLASTGCKKKMSGRGVDGPGSGAPDDGGCCGTSSGPEGALVPLGLGVLGLGFVARRRR